MEQLGQRPAGDQIACFGDKLDRVLGFSHAQAHVGVVSESFGKPKPGEIIILQTRRPLLMETHSLCSHGQKPLLVAEALEDFG
jgi:hypothetical protein